MLRSILLALRHIKNYKEESKLERILAEINYFEKLSLEDKNNIQNRLILEIADYSKKYVPYYKKFGGSFDSNTREFENWPILTKEIIRENKSDVLTTEVISMQENTSGGSTGEPIVIYQCSNYWLWRVASNNYVFEQITQKHHKDIYLVRLWGSERDIILGSVGLRQKIRNYLNQVSLLNSFKMDNEIMTDYIKSINHANPDIIEAYVHSMYDLSKYILEDNKLCKAPLGIILSAGTLYDFIYNDIKRAFPNSIIVNRYGSREVGNVACSCAGYNYLHISMLTHFVEVVDNDGQQLEDGKLGNIIVTSLTNKAMPLIRYFIGDRGILRRGSVCPKCGWVGDILEIVAGRNVDRFRNKFGENIDGEYFTHLFYFRKWVNKFQIIQTSLDKLEINIVLDEKVSQVIQNEKEEIEEAIRKVLPEINIEWNFPKELKHDPSGKLRYTISNVR